MPEEIVDTRNEKIKDVELEEEIGPVKRLLLRVQENKFIKAIKKISQAIKNAKARSAEKKLAKKAEKQAKAESKDAKDKNTKAKK